ncbi:hypothetical protein ACFLYA_02670 [Candidatus Dependentiae bacterium]
MAITRNLKEERREEKTRLLVDVFVENRALLCVFTKKSPYNIPEIMPIIIDITTV